MKVVIQPSAIKGEIYAAASKSAMQRACAAALLHNGQTIISNPGQSNDDLAALSIIKNLGATIQNEKDASIKITGSELLNVLKALPTGEGLAGAINCGESGLSIRMFAPIAALSSDEITITGSGSLLSRPMDFFDEILPQLGVSIQSHNGKLPLKIKGPLQPKNITIDGSLSSQFLTGLLMAFAKAATEKVTITVMNLKSKPYIDLTLQMMEHFGYKVTNENYECFVIQPATSNAGIISYSVEGDWSGAAFLLVAGAIAGNVTIKGLDVFSAQADKAILQALMMAKASISITPEEIIVSAKSMQAFHFNATDCPDLFPPLVALAAYCEGTSVIEGVSRLAHKESNRALTLQEEFGKIGVTIKLQDDLMLITGGDKIKGTKVHSHHDHRIAMACAVAALKAEGETIIEDAEAINKSYPAFYKHLQQLGASVNIHD
ncbi:MAG: 3-phosphoshikimate 1-carboxyvinyltransferase [Ferruginibacter sp.]